MRDMMMVPASEFQRMRQRHIAQATTNTVLEKVGDLGATEDAILESNLPASMAIALASPLERRRRTLTKRLRTGGERGNSYGADNDPEPLVNTPSEALVKKLIAKVGKTNRGRDTPRRILPPTPPTTRPSTAGPSRLPRPITGKNTQTSDKTPKSTSRIPRPTTGKKTQTPKSRPGLKQAAIKGASKSLAKALGFSTGDKDTADSSDEELSPRRTRGQRLRELRDWKSEKSPTKRRLAYDEQRRRRPPQPKSWETYQERKRSKKQT